MGCFWAPARCCTAAGARATELLSGAARGGEHSFPLSLLPSPPNLVTSLPCVSRDSCPRKGTKKGDIEVAACGVRAAGEYRFAELFHGGRAAGQCHVRVLTVNGARGTACVSSAAAPQAPFRAGQCVHSCKDRAAAEGGKGAADFRGRVHSRWAGWWQFLCMHRREGRGQH